MLKPKVVAVEVLTGLSNVDLESWYKLNVPEYTEVVQVNANTIQAKKRATKKEA